MVGILREFSVLYSVFDFRFHRMVERPISRYAEYRFHSLYIGVDNYIDICLLAISGEMVHPKQRNTASERPRVLGFENTTSNGGEYPDDETADILRRFWECSKRKCQRETGVRLLSELRDYNVDIYEFAIGRNTNRTNRIRI